MNYLIDRDRKIEEIKNDHDCLKILKEIKRNPRGLKLYEIVGKKAKTGIASKRYVYKKLKNMETEPALIRKKKVGRYVIRTLTNLGKMVLLQKYLEEKSDTTSLMEEEYRFFLGKGGRCKVTYYIPYGSANTRQYLANEMAVSIEKAVDNLLYKSRYLLESKDKIEARIIIELDVDGLNEDIMAFRDYLFNLKEEVNRLKDMWNKQIKKLWYEQNQEGSKPFTSKDFLKLKLSTRKALYLGNSIFRFEAALVRKELLKKGIEVYSLPRFMDIKWSVLPEKIKRSIEKGQSSLFDVSMHYSPDFIFFIENERVDLRKYSLEVQEFFSWLEKPRIQEWIIWNQQKDHLWFNEIPWELAPLDTIHQSKIRGERYEAVKTKTTPPKKDDKSRYLFHWMNPKTILNPHIRFLFHMLKRVPVSIGAKIFFDEVEYWLDQIEAFKKEGIKETSLTQSVNDFIFFSTYDYCRKELKRQRLPSDLKTYIEPYVKGNRKDVPTIVVPHTNWYLAPLNLITRKVLRLMLETHSKYNALTDKFIANNSWSWREKGKPVESWMKIGVIKDLREIGKGYTKLVKTGIDHEEALGTVITEMVSPLGFPGLIYEDRLLY